LRLERYDPRAATFTAGSSVRSPRSQATTTPFRAGRDVDPQRVNAIAEDHGPDDHLYEYLCECPNADCTFHVHLAVREYESVRSDPTQFAVLPEHYTPEIEELVARNERFWIVKKTGDAGRYVAGLDPRSRG
jgi:hypothetical protein